MEEAIHRTLRIYGILFIILGVITFIFTYRYVVPMGSVILILSGLMMILSKR